MALDNNTASASQDAQSPEHGYWRQLWRYLNTKANGDDAHFLGAGLIGLILPTALLLSYALRSLAWTEWLNTASIVIVSLIGITALALPKSQAKYPKVPGPLIVFAAVTSILIAVVSAYYKGLGDAWTLQ